MKSQPKPGASRTPLQTFGAIAGISGNVDRKLYLIVGISLMALKYIGEAFFVLLMTKEFFHPIAFLIPSMMVRDHYFSLGPPWMAWAVVVWSLPFAWVALTMSARRAIDAGGSPMLGMIALMPFINIPFMIVMACWPSAIPVSNPPSSFDRDLKATQKRSLTSLYSAVLGISIGGLFALAATVFSAHSLHNYGSSLFVAMPTVSGCVAGFVYNQPNVKSFWGSIGIGALSVCLGGLGLLLFAFEGVICLLMASPMLLPLGALGGMLGWGLATTIVLQSRWMLGGALLIFPFLGIFENYTKTFEEIVVESSVTIAASKEEVWKNVVSFPDIESPPAWYFRWGVASPLRARIVEVDGEKVRHCEFTTGSFVEPITCWDQPNRLCFDVTDQPDPLIELTPYRSVRPPHLQHSFKSHRGEFELIENSDGTTTLVGRTWYSVDMGPRVYWRLWTDEIIHRIHLRVLNHIRDQAEGETLEPH